MILRVLAVVIALVLSPRLHAASPIDRPSQPVLDRTMDQDDAYFKTDEARCIVDNIASWQNDNGGWWKAYDPAIPRPADIAPAAAHLADANDQTNDWLKTSTFDNGATISEMRILARAHRLTGDPKSAQSFERGMKFIFDSQYPHGGWPQRFPLEDNYGRLITFNDRLMVNILELLRDVAEGKEDFAFISQEQRQRAKEAFDRGIDAILKCQIQGKDGSLTAWCQQHDEKTFAPAKARSYELPSISAFESADITLLLMRLENPDERVRKAIEGAVAWYEKTRITGKRYDKTLDANGKTTDRVLSDDPSGVLWARFYDLETGRPFFANRDGTKTENYSEVLQERRAGYMWFGPFGQKVLAEYPKWKQRVGGQS